MLKWNIPYLERVDCQPLHYELMDSISLVIHSFKNCSIYFVGIWLIESFQYETKSLLRRES